MGKTSYRIPNVSCTECPVSLITEQSKALLEMESMNRHTHTATGATLHGPDAALWPAVWHDVVTLVQIQRTLDDAAYQRSLNDGRQ